MLEENFRSLDINYEIKVKIKLIKMEELEKDGTIAVYIFLYIPSISKDLPNHCSYFKYHVNSQGLKLTTTRPVLEKSIYNIDQSILISQPGGGSKLLFLTNFDP
jgi:hypothetical protein